MFAKDYFNIPLANRECPTVEVGTGGGDTVDHSIYALKAQAATDHNHNGVYTTPVDVHAQVKTDIDNYDNLHVIPVYAKKSEAGTDHNHDTVYAKIVQLHPRWSEMLIPYPFGTTTYTVALADWGKALFWAASAPGTLNLAVYDPPVDPSDPKWDAFYAPDSYLNKELAVYNAGGFPLTVVCPTGTMPTRFRFFPVDINPVIPADHVGFLKILSRTTSGSGTGIYQQIDYWLEIAARVDKVSLATHNHDSVYAKIANAATDHNHDAVYAKIANAATDHNHDPTYAPRFRPVQLYGGQQMVSMDKTHWGKIIWIEYPGAADGNNAYYSITYPAFGGADWSDTTSYEVDVLNASDYKLQITYAPAPPAGTTLTFHTNAWWIQSKGMARIKLLSRQVDNPAVNVQRIFYAFTGDLVA